MYNQQDKERQICADLKAQGKTRKEIADITGLSERQVKRRLAGNTSVAITTGEFKPWDYCDRPAVTEFNRALGVPPQEKEERFLPLSMEKDSSLFNMDAVDQRRNEIKQFIEAQFAGKPVKVLYMADLHIPFTNYEKVNALINNHDNADVLVINGDMLDLFAVSKFAKDKQVALQRELSEGRTFLEYVASKFKYVIVTEGNHERRLKNYIVNVIPPDMQFLFPKDILRVMADGTTMDKESISNVFVVGSWWINLWDTIYAHPDNYSTAAMRTVINTSEHFLLVKGIQHRVCMIGHTHQAGELVRGGVKLMETGCLCYPMDYHNGSKFTKTAWTYAHAVQHIDEKGQTDFNKTTVIYL